MKKQVKLARRTTVKIGVSRQVVIPKRIHDELGLVPGDYLMVELKGDKVVMTPQTLIEKGIAAGLEDIRKGRVHGPFATASEAIASLHKNAKMKSV